MAETYYKKFFEGFHIMDKTSYTDPMTGPGFTWSEGAAFNAGITADNSSEARIAYQQGAKVIYTIVMEPTLSLSIGDRIKRDKTDDILKITSDPRDFETPVVAKVKLKTCTAEVIRP